MSAPADRMPLLLVEDADDVALIVDYLLSREGHAVERAADGRRAVERIRTGPPPPLVILDLMLPHHDGFELLGMLRAQPGRGAVPGGVVSAREQGGGVVRWHGR